MDLTTLTDQELEEAFKIASDLGESLSILISEKARRIKLSEPSDDTVDTCPVDPAEESQCDSCQ